MMAGVLDGLSLRAGSFIVTLYGDVVEPRGGRLWMGNIIETCASMGISETLVRTAVSRLVSAGQFVGEREGRRSFYRLTDVARQQFLAASRILFEPTRPGGWTFAWLPPGSSENEPAELEKLGFARLAEAWFVGPSQALPDGWPGLVFDATSNAAPALARAFAAAHWRLEALAASYADFLRRFAPVQAALEAGQALSPAQALQLRLVLVHLFRHAALQDPRLPEMALPVDWPGHSARRLFARLYCALSPGADLHILNGFVSEAGALPGATPMTEHRLAGLARYLEGPGPP